MDEEEELNLPVPVAVPTIIGKAQFQRIAARRTERSPRKSPPLHVNPKTLLTGLCKCGYCNSSMSISTGKSGRYRYLKCNKRNTQSTTSCASPNVPYEKFEKLALKCILEHLLTDVRLETILDDCRSHADALSKTHGPERMQILETKAQVQRKLKNLYKLVEDEKITIDSVLGERIQNWQDELNELTVKLNSLKVPVALPANLIDTIDIADFRTAAMAILEDPKSEEAKDFMHLVVQEIRIYAEEATIAGPNLGVLEAALTHNRVSMPSVPSFISNWRQRGSHNKACKPHEQTD